VAAASKTPRVPASDAAGAGTLSEELIPHPPLLLPLRRGMHAGNAWHVPSVVDVVANVTPVALASASKSVLVPVESSGTAGTGTIHAKLAAGPVYAICTTAVTDPSASTENKICSPD